ncbi:MAG: hypothetical protein ACI3XI_07135 [Eubacteriales bacterium]
MSASKSRMTRGRLTFICVWLAIFAVSYLIWALYLGALTRSLVKYDEYAPENTAQKIFDLYFRTPDPNTLVSVGGSELSQFENREAAEKYLSELIDGKELTFCENGSDEDTKRYEVSAGGTVFAEFTLVQNHGLKEIFGRRAWKLDRLKLLITP